MAIVRMKKLAFSVYDTVREQLLTELQKAGCFHISSIGGEPVAEGEDPDATIGSTLVPVSTDSRSLETFAAELADAIEFLEGYVPPVKMGMIQKMSQPQPQVTVSQMIAAYKKFDLPLLISDIYELEKNFKEADNRIQALAKEKADLVQWKDSGLDLDILNGKTTFLAGLTGYVSLAAAPVFAGKALEISPYLEVIEAFSTPKETYFYIIYLRSEDGLIADKLKDLGFVAAPVSNRTGTVSEAVAAIDKEYAKQEFRREYERALIGGMLAQLDTLKVVYDYVRILQARAEAQNLGVKTDTVSFYTGWIPAKRELDIYKLMVDFREVDFTIEDPSKGELEEVPVYMVEKKSVQPFKFLTDMYGTPLYNNVDPTAHLSPFYFLFFGFCFADVAYGLLLFLIAGYVAIRTRKNKGTSNAMKFFSLMGLSSILFGFVFKGAFGDLFTNPAYPTYFAPFANLWGIDTLKSPMLTLFIALNFGAVHLLYGLLINLVHEYKVNKLEAVMTNLSWFIFIVGFFGWALYSWMAKLAGIPGLPPAALKVDIGILLTGVAFILVNAIRTSKKTVGGIIGGFLGGLYRVYGVSSYVSDILSYARLLALGLAGSVIASVFNMLGFMVFDGSSVKVIGYIGLFALLIFGHVFNFVISAFGAFVHSLRLQFVEFFSKFMKSGGQVYTPLKEEGVFYEVKTEEN